jgi:hypothetical protein
VHADHHAQLRKLHCDFIEADAQIAALRPHIDANIALRLSNAQRLARAARQLIDQAIVASAVTIDGTPRRRQA